MISVGVLLKYLPNFISNFLVIFGVNMEVILFTSRVGQIHTQTDRQTDRQTDTHTQRQNTVKM